MQNVIWFKDLSIKNVPEVGGKNASLGEMYNALIKKKVNIPNGFAVTAGAYEKFLRENKLPERMRATLKGLNTHNISNLQKRGKKIREMILAAEIPSDIKKDVIQAYRELSREFGVKNADVAVRSSATAEDLPNASTLLDNKKPT